MGAIDRERDMSGKDMTYELLKVSKMSAERANKSMLVFLIEMALLEAESCISSGVSIKRRHPAYIPQIPLQGSARKHSRSNIV
jgi:hypothetical protein